jgi:PAS domain S-box-containing protein
MSRPAQKHGPADDPREAALRLSEATKTAILQTALDCIVTIDRQGRVVDWNPAAEKTFGYSRSETLGREMGQLIIPPELLGTHRAGLSRAVASGHDSMAGRRIEIMACRKSGEVFPVELAITRIATGESLLFTGHIRDISERRKTEQRQAAQYAVVHALAGAANLSEAAPKILRAVCECLSWDLGVLWSVDKSAGVLRPVDSWQKDEITSTEFISQTRRSSFSPGTGLPGRIWSAREAQWIVNVLEDNNFPRSALAARDGFQAAFGFPIRLADEVLGVVEFFSHEIRQPEAECLEMFGAIGSQIGQFIERIEAEENLRKLNHVLERRIAERTIDIQKAKENLRKALKQEKELSRLQSNFVNVVSHEFRTPLAVIMSAAEILQTYFDRLTPEQRSDHLQDIRNATAQMSGLMEEVLLLGRVESGKMECRRANLNLEEFCRNLVSELISATNRKCPLELILLNVSGQASGDEPLLRHIITNLLSNAVKYSPPDSPVRLKVCREGREARFEICDQGIGIPNEDQARLFEPFHRARNVGEIPGTGLGLVIARRCLELHQGWVEYSSKPGCGTTFVVGLDLFELRQKFCYREGGLKSVK